MHAKAALATTDIFFIKKKSFCKCLPKKPPLTSDCSLDPWTEASFLAGQLFGSLLDADRIPTWAVVGLFQVNSEDLAGQVRGSRWAEASFLAGQFSGSLLDTGRFSSWAVVGLFQVNSEDLAG